MIHSIPESHIIGPGVGIITLYFFYWLRLNLTDTLKNWALSDQVETISVQTSVATSLRNLIKRLATPVSSL
jgi:hypothetical protein